MHTKYVRKPLSKRQKHDHGELTGQNVFNVDRATSVKKRVKRAQDKKKQWLESTSVRGE